MCLEQLSLHLDMWKEQTTLNEYNTGLGIFSSQIQTQDLMILCLYLRSIMSDLGAVHKIRNAFLAYF